MFKDNSMEIFSSRDKTRNQLVEFAKQYLDLGENLDFSKTSYLSYIVNILSGLTSNLVFYNTATYREFFLTKANQKESVINLAAMVGYNAQIATPATTQVLITMPIDFTSSSEIVFKGRHDSESEPFKFYAGDIPFSCENEVRVKIIISRGRVLAASVQEINKLTGGTKNINWRFSSDRKSLHFLINVTQVEDIVTTFQIPNLSPYDFFNKDIEFEGSFSGIELSTKKTTEQDYTDWDSRTSIFLISPGENAYSYRVGEKGIKILFGNGIIGTQPEPNLECKAIVSVTKGLKGNVISGSINRADRLYVVDESGTTVYNKPVLIYVINSIPATGGTDYPTIDEIRYNAIAQVSTNNRLVTKYDYDNAKTVIEDLPIQNSIPVLKRSDVKRNEICMFTDLIYENQYVPTQNSVVFTDSTNISFNQELTIIPSVYEITDSTSSNKWRSIFDITIDPTTNTCLYYYLLDNFSKEVTLKQSYTSNTVVTPTVSEFLVDKDTSTLTVNLFFEIIEDDTRYSDLSCLIEINETGEFYDTTYVDTTSSKYFTLDIPISSIEEGELYFDFYIKYTYLGTTYSLLDCQVQTLIKQNLDEFMYSKVKSYTLDSTSGWALYDVPMILGDYLDVLESDDKLNNFKETIIHRISTFDVTQYRMLTDFVNLKLSNTYDNMINMNHNKVTRGFINTPVDPDSIPCCPLPNACYAVTNDKNAWSSSPWNKTTGGFLAKFIQTGDGTNWTFINLKPNDILYYTEVVSDGLWSREPDDCEKLIYNGENLVSMNKKIPLELEIWVWQDPLISMSEQALINSVKENILRYFIPKMGYDKSLYLSELSSVIQNTSGVKNCKIIKPEHDIFFNYDLDKFEAEDLLRYTPELVYLTTNSINVIIRK